MLQPSASTGRSWPHVTYVDAFAGPGEYIGGEEGSPVFALDRLLRHDAATRMQLKRERVHLILTEERRDRFEHLKALLASRFGPLDRLPVTVTPRRAEAGTATGALLSATGAWRYPVLAVFDSWGNVGVPLSLIRQLARNPASEVIVTFGPNWFNRREQMEPDHLDLVFGGRANWEPADRESPRLNGGGHGWLRTATRYGARASVTSCSSRSFPTPASRSTWSSGPGTRRGSR